MDDKVKSVELIKIRQPNSALYYFDQEKRQEILKQNTVQSAEQAYNLIKSSFDACNKERYDKMAASDLDRFH